MSKSKRVELQITVQNQDQWDDLLQKEGLIVVDAYAAWCGPCKAAVSTLKRIKNEIGDSLLHFATAETDRIDSLLLYRGKSQPTFLFYANGTLVYVIRGCNCPVILKTITNQLEREHKVLDGKVDRIEFIDKEVGMEKLEEKKDEIEDVNEEDEEIAAQMTESLMRMKNKVSFKALDEETEVSKEVSLAIIKPDAVKAGLVDEIIAKMEADGMEILRKEERTLTKEEAAEFYKQHEGSEHFEDLVEFMSSGPCLTLIISKGETGDGVIPQIRDLIGPKDIHLAKEQAPTSIRALYGTSSVMNAIHACDTCESAARELAFFYPDFVSPAVKTKKTKRAGNQRTLALIRPDALRHHKDSIIAKVEEAGFSIAMAKELTLTREEAEDFYSEHKGKDFYETLIHNMCSGPVMALCLAKEDAVEGWRHVLGPKEIDVATEEAPESLRAQFKVEESDFNPLHGSDSVTAADREIEKIFPVQTTVAVIKPEAATENGDEIINKIKESGFRIISRKDVGLTKELASQFYSEHTGKDFFDGLTDYMSSGQSTVLLLEREDAVTGWRAMMGPTDPDEAREKAPDSIRAVFGKDIVRNAVHGSSDMSSAGKVIEELFPDVELSNGRATVSNSKEDVRQNSTDEENVTEDKNADESGSENERQVPKEEGQVPKEEGQVPKEEGQVTEQDINGDETTGVKDDVATEQGGTGKDVAGGNDSEAAVGTKDIAETNDGSTKDNDNSAGDDNTVGDSNTVGDGTIDTGNDNNNVDVSTNDTTGDGTNDPTTGNKDAPSGDTSKDVTSNDVKDGEVPEHSEVKNDNHNDGAIGGEDSKEDEKGNSNTTTSNTDLDGTSGAKDSTEGTPAAGGNINGETKSDSEVKEESG